MSELRGLGAANDEFRKSGVTIAAISPDTPKAAARIVEKYKLPFPILSDPKCEAISAFGLIHKGGGPKSADTAIPAHILIGRDGKILWTRVARRIQDRPSPEETLRNVRAALQWP